MKLLLLVKSFLLEVFLGPLCVRVHTYTHILVHSMSVELRGQTHLDPHLPTARQLENQLKGQEARQEDTTHHPLELTGIYESSELYIRNKAQKQEVCSVAQGPTLTLVYNSGIYLPSFEKTFLDEK